MFVQDEASVDSQATHPDTPITSVTEHSAPTASTNCQPTPSAGRLNNSQQIAFAVEHQRNPGQRPALQLGTLANAMGGIADLWS